MNSLYQQLNPTNLSNSNIGRVKQLMQMCKTAQNPQATLLSAINQNPQMKSVLEMLQQSGGDAKTLFYKLAEQKGVNPDDILNQLK